MANCQMNVPVATRTLKAVMKSSIKALAISLGVGLPLSFIAFHYGYILVHNGIVLLMAIAPAYFMLERADGFPNVGWLSIVLFTFLQVLYYFVMFSLLSKGIARQQSAK